MKGRRGVERRKERGERKGYQRLKGKK